MSQKQDVPADDSDTDSNDVPEWCNVLEGMIDEDRDEFLATLDTPVRLAHSE